MLVRAFNIPLVVRKLFSILPHNSRKHAPSRKGLEARTDYLHFELRKNRLRGKHCRCLASPTTPSSPPSLVKDTSKLKSVKKYLAGMPYLVTIRCIRLSKRVLRGLYEAVQIRSLTEKNQRITYVGCSPPASSLTLPPGILKAETRLKPAVNFSPDILLHCQMASYNAAQSSDLASLRQRLASWYPASRTSCETCPHSLGCTRYYLWTIRLDLR